MDEQSGIATIVHDELRTFVAGVRQGGESEIPVFFEGFAFVRVHRDTGLGDGRGGMVLGGEENIAPLAQRTLAPSSTSVSMRMAVSMVMCKEPVMRTPLNGLAGPIFLADSHQAGHFVLGNLDGFTAPFGERQVAHRVVLFSGTVAAGFDCTAGR